MRAQVAGAAGLVTRRRITATRSRGQPALDGAFGWRNRLAAALDDTSTAQRARSCAPSMASSRGRPGRRRGSAHLMYVGGSEGPPATSLRVLRDRARRRQRPHHHRPRPRNRAGADKARTGTGAEYDAKLDKAQSSCAIASSRASSTWSRPRSCRGCCRRAKLTGEWAQKPTPTSRTRRCDITPSATAGGRHMAARHLSGAAKSGCPSCRIRSSGDIVFVGQPEAKRSDSRRRKP